MTALRIDDWEIRTNGNGVEFTSPNKMLEHYRAVKKRLWERPTPPTLAKRPVVVPKSVPALPKVKPSTLHLTYQLTLQWQPGMWIQPGASVEPSDSVQPRIEPIIAEVAAKYGVMPREVKGRSRTKVFVFARQEAMYLIRERHPEISLPTIGRLMGGRDHTTVLHSIAAHAYRHKLRKLVVSGRFPR